LSQAAASPIHGDRRPALKREYSQLLRLQEHLLNELQLLQNELDSPLTEGILEQIESRAESPVPELFHQAGASIWRALELLRQCEVELLSELRVEVTHLNLGGITNLPQRLSRFLAERDGIPGFAHEVRRDSIRGWVIHGKERDEDGALRGAGQFYERPYAWLDD
jgi:hypothetical protein